MMADLQLTSGSSLTGTEQQVRQSVQMLEFDEAYSLLNFYLKQLAEAVQAEAGNELKLRRLKQQGRQLFGWVAKMAAIDRAVAAVELTELNCLTPYHSPEPEQAYWQIQG